MVAEMSMKLTKKGYKPRYIDDKVEEYLEIFGAVAVEGTPHSLGVICGITKPKNLL